MTLCKMCGVQMLMTGECKFVFVFNFSCTVNPFFMLYFIVKMARNLNI